MLPSTLIALAALQGLQFTVERRAVLLAFSGANELTTLAPAVAIDDGPVAPRALTEEEMEARVARKMELLRAQSRRSSAPGGGSALDSYLQSDINPEAGANLRSRGMLENAKASLAKQAEIKTRSKAQKRDDLCEMLGRGC